MCGRRTSMASCPWCEVGSPRRVVLNANIKNRVGGASEQRVARTSPPLQIYWSIKQVGGFQAKFREDQDVAVDSARMLTDFSRCDVKDRWRW